MLTISNIDKKTEEIIVFIAQQAGGKVIVSDVDSALNAKKSLKENPFEDFDAKMDSIISSIKERHNAISDDKIK